METLPTTELATVPTPIEPPTESTTTPHPSISVEKTGEMAFSDQPDNRYISAIASKYGVDAKKLVALYTVPENDSNIVLEFDGTENADGSLVRNKSTLVAIYSIDRELNSKRASENKALNEYSYGEMKVMFFSTTTENDYCWGVYMAPVDMLEEVDRIFSSLFIIGCKSDLPSKYSRISSSESPRF